MATNYKEIAKQARIKVLQMIYSAQTSHIGSNFSVIDIMAVLFEKADLSKDKIILSAGWKAAAFYYFLAQKGIIPKEALDTYCQEGSPYIGLTEPMPGIHFAGGSMGLGFPGAAGFALAKKMSGDDGRIYVIMSDGELQCGTFYESLLISTHHKLDNLTLIVDGNGLQAMGKIDDILSINLLHDFSTPVLDGHNYAEIEQALADKLSEQPSLLFFTTIKGKGVSFMEGENLYHYKAPSEEEYQLALQELNG